MRDPSRLSAVQAARHQLPAAPMPLDAIARLAARLTRAPMAAVTLVGADEEYFAGVHAMPRKLVDQGRAPLAYSVCKYIVSQDHPISSIDLLGEESRQLRDHPLAGEYGVRAFLGVPVRDRADRPLGSLTVFDTAARQWTDDQLVALLEIAELVRPADAEAPSTVTGLDCDALLDSVQEAFLAVDADGIVAAVNRSATNLLGYAASEVCGRHLDDSLLPGYDGQPISAALGRLFAAAPRRPVLREISIRHRDGRRLAMRASLSVVPGASGALACVFLTDLSGQTAAEDLAERHSSFLSALLDSLSVGVMACDDTGRVVLINRALREVHGMRFDDPLPDDYPATFEQIAHDAAEQPMTWRQAPLTRALHGEHVTDVDVVIQQPGERTRIFASTAQPITSSAGQRLGAVAVAHEVTALRRAERFRDCHRDVEAILRAGAPPEEAAPPILEAVATTLGWPYAELYLVDDTTGDLRSVGHYDATGDDSDGLFGHSPQYGQGITGRVWQSGQPIWLPDLADAEQLRTPYEQERLAICLRRGIRTVLAVPVRDGGTLLGVLTCYAGAPEHHEDLLTVLLDGIAGQIGVHIALRRAEQLARQLERAQTDFIDLVGHEMRTPLTSIAANAGMLAEDATLLDDEHRHMAHVIARNAGVVQSIVDTLLELASFESGHTTLVQQQVDLAAVVREAIDAAAAQHTGSATITADLPRQLTVPGDATRLRQVIDDLLSNAVKYSPPDGRITVQAHTDGQLAELCISDTGIGTPAGEHGRVFDRFYRASNVRHHGIPGSGLGLSLARAIIGLHGGTISLADNEPTGTVVCVRLPLTTPETVRYAR